MRVTFMMIVVSTADLYVRNKSGFCFLSHIGVIHTIKKFENVT